MGETIEEVIKFQHSVEEGKPRNIEQDKSLILRFKNQHKDL